MSNSEYSRFGEGLRDFAERPVYSGIDTHAVHGTDPTINREELGIQQLTAMWSGSTLPLRVESAQNLTAILQEAQAEFARVGFMSPTEFEAQVHNRTEIIRAGHRTSINITVASLKRMLSVGTHESAWSHLRESGVEGISGSSTAQGKNIHDGYFEHRAAVEHQLASYVSDCGSGEPVYAAVASNNREYLHGACPEYGNITVILNESTIDPNSTVYAWSDSLVGSLNGDDQNEITIEKTQVLTKEDAMTAKAVVDILREYNRRFASLGNSGLVRINPGEQDRLVSTSGGYVETVLFQGVHPDMIESISIAGDMAEAVKAINQYPKIAKKTIFVAQEGESELVKDYVATHFTVVKQHISGDIELHTIDPKRWESLGVDFTASPTVIQQALIEKAQSLLKKPGTELSRLAIFLKPYVRRSMNTAQGLRHALHSLRGKIDRASEEAQAQYIDALRLQEALAFFETVAAQSSF